MQTFILLTRLPPEALKSPASMEDFEKRAVQHIEQECPDVKWLNSYVLLGPYDYLDIFTAPEMNVVSFAQRAKKENTASKYTSVTAAIYLSPSVKLLSTNTRNCDKSVFA